MSTEPDPDRPATYPADTSLAEVLDDFVSRGYDGQFDVDEDTGACTCATCGTATPPDAMTFEDARRMEGASDPAEMANVLALRCPSCGTRGVLACRYGPEASQGESALLRAARGINQR